MTKLTKSQFEFLKALSSRPMATADTYKPPEKLVALGLATFELRPFSRKLYTITDKGLEAYKEKMRET